jgi:phosphinothricin acetyltransferase
MIEIVPLIREHWDAVRRIHAQGIETGAATFETEPASAWERWSEEHLECCRLVAMGEGRVVGWAALSPVSDRCVYGQSEEHGFWTLQAGVFPENEPSIALHEKYGFRVVGRRESLGKLRGRWQDVLLLERRSQRVGVD